MISHRKGVLLDGIGSELVRSSNGGARKTLSTWLGDLSNSINLGDIASTFTSGDATPSVLDNSKFITTGSTAITNFDDGVEGQVITIYRGASDIAITDNATIDPIISGNLTLSAARPSATFRLASGVWKQVEEAGAASTALLTVIQSATVNAAMEDYLDSGTFTATGGGTARSLKDWFRGCARGSETITADGFWFDITATTQVWRLKDRVAVGYGADQTFNRASPQGTPVSTSTDGANWAIRDAQFLSFAQASGGGMAVVGFSRTSDCYTNHISIGVSGFVINNGTGNGAWALYSDVQHESTAVGSSYGLELAIKNKSTDVTPGPYGLGGPAAFGLWVVGGGDNAYGGSATNPSAAALAIVKGDDYGWNTGIVFEKDALTGCDGVTGTGNAMIMARGMQVTWQFGAGSVGAFIRSDVDTANQGAKLIFDNNVTNFYNSPGGLVASMINTAGNTASTQYVVLRNQAAGTYPGVEATGTDTNVGLHLNGKGAADIRLERADSSTNTAPTVLTLRRASTGSPATGIGAAMDFTVETAADNYEIGISIAAVSTDVTGGSEDFDLVFYNMAGGAAAAEKMRLRSDGQLQVLSANATAIRATNIQDAAAVVVLRLDGDRATFAANDVAYMDLRLSNDAGTQIEMARLQWRATDITAGSEDAHFRFGVQINGVLTSRVDITGTAIAPVTNDTVAIGATGLGISDFYLASGAVIDFASANVTITHSSNALAIVASSGVSCTGDLTAGSGTGITAGGSLVGLQVSSTANFGVFVGSGAPSISAAQGSLYLRSDGSSTSTRAYIATNGSGTWTAITTAA